jgi:hypothetical protein
MLEKVCRTTIGFGPFVFLKCKLMPDALATYVHAKLQRLADRRVPFITSTGIACVALAQEASFVAQHCNARLEDSP